MYFTSCFLNPTFDIYTLLQHTSFHSFYFNPAFTSSYSIQALTALIFILSLMLTAQNKHPLAKGEISYYDINLLYSRIHLKWISLCYCAKSWRQNTFRVFHWKCSTPLYSRSASLIGSAYLFLYISLCF